MQLSNSWLSDPLVWIVLSALMATIAGFIIHAALGFAVLAVAAGYGAHLAIINQEDEPPQQTREEDDE